MNIDVPMQDEWVAWRLTNEALAAAADGATWDDDQWKVLHSAIVYWGEFLAALRISQPLEVREEALTEAAHKYRRSFTANIEAV